MTEDRRTSLSDASLEVDARYVNDCIVQLTRVLRIVAVHRLENKAVQTVRCAFIAAIDAAFERMPLVRVQTVEGALYFNSDFVKVKGMLYESAEQLKDLFDRLGIDDLAISARLEPAEVDEFLVAFQNAIQGPEPERFALAKFGKIEVRAAKRKNNVEVDDRMELARTYAQLVVLMRDADRAMEDQQVFSLARVRRAVQQLVDASQRLDALLAGLTQFDDPERGAGEHAAAVVALTLILGRKVGLRRKELANLGMAAALHDLGSRLESGTDDESAALGLALSMAPLTSSLEALDRAALCFERHVPAEGKVGWPTPRTAAQFIAVACAYDRLTHPRDGSRGLPAARAVALLRENRDNFFDPRVLRLFVSVVGTVPVGSLVRLSDGRQAVVVDVPSGQRQPLVRIVSNDIGRSHLVDLNEKKSLKIAEAIEPTQNDVSTVPFLLA